MADAAAAFVDESVRRMAVLNRQQIVCDMKPLYDVKTKQLLLEAAGQHRTTVCPNLHVFRALFRAFTGSVADIKLPAGAFFAGSSVLAAATIAEGCCSDDLIKYLTDQIHREDLIYRRRFMCVHRKCGRLSTTIRVMGFLGNRLGIMDPDELRANIVHITGEGPWPTNEEDVFSWTNNGFGDYARSDVDIFVCAKDQHEGDAKVRRIYETICAVDGEDCAAIRTPNTVTICRSWPERHVQIILLTMQQPSHHLLFADMDCTCLAYKQGQVWTTSRSRRALSTGCNLIPYSMLANRQDTPKRVAAYAKRGFLPKYLVDDSAYVGSAATSALLAKVQESLQHPGKKLFNMAAITNVDDDDVDFEDAVRFLMKHNTSYCSWNCPRMAGLTAAHIAEFFRRMDRKASAQDSTVVATIVRDQDDLPPTQDKLVKSGREKWIGWGLIREKL